MASVRAGDIRQLTVDGRELDVVGGDSNVNIDTGGFSNEVGVSGNKNIYVTQRIKIAGFSDCPISVDDTRQDLEFLQEIANDGEPVPCNLTLASGVTYSGSLIPVGDLVKASGDGTLTLEMRGATFEQI